MGNACVPGSSRSLLHRAGMLISVISTVLITQVTSLGWQERVGMVRLDVALLAAEESCLSAHCSQHGKDQFLRCSVGRKGSQIWSGLSCLLFSL